MRSSFVTVAALLPALVGSGAARAQNPTVSEAQAKPNLMTDYGESLVVSGGVTDFINDSIRRLTDLGGFWEARLGLGTRFWVGVEAAYVGSARKIRAPGVSSNLIGHGAEGHPHGPGRRRDYVRVRSLPDRGTFYLSANVL